jgi:hypothetical protein
MSPQPTQPQPGGSDSSGGLGDFLKGKTAKGMGWGALIFGILGLIFGGAEGGFWGALIGSIAGGVFEGTGIGDSVKNALGFGGKKNNDAQQAQSRQQAQGMGMGTQPQQQAQAMSAPPQQPYYHPQPEFIEVIPPGGAGRPHFRGRH